MPKITEASIASIAIPAGKREAWLSDSVVQGLRLRATSGGAKTFFACWTDRATGERRREKIGTWGAITLEQARKAARGILGDVARGGDPKAQRIAQRAAADMDKAERALTLDALIREWASLHLSARRVRYATEAQRALRHAFAQHLDTPAARLPRAEVLGVLAAMAAAGKTALAGRTMAYGRACYAWSMKRGRVVANPFAGLPIQAGASARERVLTDAEIGRAWNAASAMIYPWGPLFRLLLLTLGRRNEAAAMGWSEISEDGSTWVIPAARMKRGQAHAVHLAEPARAILASIPRIEGQDLIFSNTGATPVSGFTKPKARLDAAIGAVDWVLHDFRRTGVSWLAGAGFNPAVADKLLAHQPSTLHGAARVYQRHDFAEERRRALEAWAAHVLRCAARVAGQDAERDGVVSLAERRRA